MGEKSVKHGHILKKYRLYSVSATMVRQTISGRIVDR